jgi:cytochrome b involved in lipid metabolism
MSKKVGWLLLGALFLAGCGSQAAPATSSTSATTKVNVNVTKSYTMAEVAPHSSATDCWMVISGKVYNVTDEVTKHPGGSAMLQGCGKDATSMFDSKPGSGKPHSSNAQAQLQNYYIGDLKQ